MHYSEQTGFWASVMGNSVGSVIVTIFATVMLFGVLIFIHELGHYLTARLFKVTIKEFSIGMGPKLWGKKSEKTGIFYALRAIPIGGYVAMEGENEDSPDPNAFAKKKVWQRMIVTAAGGTMNLILGVFLAFLFVVTMPIHVGTTVTGFPEGAFSCESAEPLRVGDEILEVNGASVRVGQEVVYEIFRAGNDPARRFMSDEYNRTMVYIDLTVLRDGEKTELHDVVFPVAGEDGVVYGMRDFYYDEQAKTFSSTMLGTARQVRLSVKTVYESLFDLIRGRYSFSQISGPVGTAGVVGEAIKSDATAEEGTGSNSFLYLCMMITVNLGLFNLLPIPALDGGRLFFQFIELVFRRPVPLKYEGLIHTVGLGLLLILMVVVAFKDIFGLFG